MTRTTKLCHKSRRLVFVFLECASFGELCRQVNKMLVGQLPNEVWISIKVFLKYWSKYIIGHRVNTKSYTPHAASSLIYQGRFAFTTQLREKEKLISETIGLKNHGWPINTPRSTYYSCSIGFTAWNCS